MALPIIPKTTFTVKNKFLPKKGIDLQPFNVGQESLLLNLIQEEGVKKDSMLKGVHQLLQECVKTEGIDVGKLPTFVIEELFIRLRQHSISEVLEFVHECDCKEHIDVTLRLEDLKVVEEDGFENVFKLSDTIGVTFKYPTLDDVSMFEVGDERDVIVSCLDRVFEGDEVHDTADLPFEEKEAFFNTLSLKDKHAIVAKFFTKLPHVYHKIETDCPSCKAHKVFEFKDLESVFI